MKLISFLLLLLLHCTTIYGQQNSKKELNYKPVNLNEAVAQLGKIHHDTLKQKITAMGEREFLSNSHFGVGMWMRNNWGLWRGGNLAKYFNSIGIFHPDDMSSIILTSYHRELHKKDWEVEEQVKYYQTYWKVTSEHFNKLKTDTAYQNKNKALHDSLDNVRLLRKQAEWQPGTRVSGWLFYKGKSTKVEGTIVQWTGKNFHVKIEKYFDEKKKDKVIKALAIKDDIAIIDYYENFRMAD